jgi:hypothetical protein
LETNPSNSPTFGSGGIGISKGVSISHKLVLNYPSDNLHSVASPERIDRDSSTSPRRDFHKSSSVVGEYNLLGCRESYLGDTDLGTVLESLVPSIKEVQSPITLTTYNGRSVYHRPEPDGGAGSSGSLVGVSGKEYMSSKGLGLETSPIKTRSARKKKETLGLITKGTHLPVIYEIGALRGPKSLARAKS